MRLTNFAAQIKNMKIYTNNIYIKNNNPIQVIGKKNRMNIPLHTKYSKFFSIITSIIIFQLFSCYALAQTPVPMVSQSSYTFTEPFTNISNTTTWPNNFITGSEGSIRWKGIAANTGTVPGATVVTTATTTFTTTTSGGVQRGTGNLVLLATGASSNTSSAAVDFFMDFTSVNAGTLTFDAAEVANSTGDRVATLKVFYSIDGSTFTELTGTNLPYIVSNNVANSATISVSLPAAFNNNTNARLRFYVFNGSAAGSTGSRAKISIDNVIVTATAIAPSITTNPTNVTVTAGTNATFSTAASGTPTLTYQWQRGISGTYTNITGSLDGSIYSGFNTTTLTVNAPSVSVTGYTYRCVVTNTASSATSTAATLTVNSAGCATAPTAVSATPSSTSLCTGATLTLTGAATGATSYSWTGPNSFTSTSLSPASFTTSTASAGVYTLSATNSCGTTTVTTSAITINTVPTSVTATPSNTSVCNGASLTLTGAATGATSYSWAGPNSFSSTSLSPASFTTSTASAGIYTLSAINSCGTITATTTAVTITSTPTAVSATPSGTSMCTGTTLTLTGAATNATSYSWAGPNSFTSTNLSPAAFTTATASAGAYTLSAINSCGTTTATTPTITINNTPTSVSIIPSANSLCTGSILTLSGTATGATSYSWSGPNSFTSTNLSPAAFTTSTLSTGIYTLSATNSCGTTNATTSITVNALPSPTINGTTTISYGNSATLTFGGVSGDVIYYWNGAATNTTTIGAGGTSNVILTPSVTATYSVTGATSAASCTSFPSGLTAVITVTGSPYDTIPTRDDNMAMGNPSAATTSTANVNNYLMVKSQYALAYNNSKGEPNWVSWHLSRAWKDTASRCNCFTADTTLPTGYFRAVTSNYTSTGFDRGHLCPSDDRDGSDTDNAATFKMTNITPQAPNLNEITWESLESYSRSLIYSGYELYIIAGGYGSGGTGSLGGTTSTIASGSISVPSHFYKIIVVLPVGSNDVSRVTTATRVIAVDMPNNQSVNSQPWGYYRTSVDAIEAATGYDFLSNVPVGIQAVIEAGIDNGPTNLMAWDFTGANADVTYAPTSVNSNLDTTANNSSLTRGATASASTGANSFRTTGFQNNGISVANTDYFETRVKAITGKKVSLSSIDATFYGTTSFAAAPGVSSQFAYSLDGTTYTLIGSPTISVGVPAVMTTVNLSSITALQNVPSTTTIYLRYYASGQTTTGGWGFYSQYAGNYGLSIDGSITADTCAGAPTAVSATASASTICSGSSLTLTANATSATSYSWSGPNSFTSTSQNPAAITTSTASAGIYTLVATNTCGSTTATTSTITINTTPTTVIATTSATTLCSGTSLTLTAAATGATAYNWSGPNSFTSTNQNPAAIITSTASAGIYTLNATNSCGSTTATTTAININTVPTAVSATPSAITLCNGTSLTLTSSATGATGYNWSGPNSFTSTDQNPTAITTSTASAGIYTLVASNSCGSTTAVTTTINIATTPTSTTATTSATTLCSGSALTLTSSATGATSYSWNGPGGYSSTSQNPAAITTSTASAGIFTVSAINSCGSTTATTAAITINTAPTAVTATPSTTSLCSDAALTLTGTATGATSYSWSGPNSFTSTDQNPAAITTSTASAGMYTLVATNSCGNTTATTASITINTAPVVNAITGTTSITVGANTTLSNTTPSGTWTSSNMTVATITSGGVVNGISTGTTTISYTVTNSCGTNSSLTTVTVTAAPIVLVGWDVNGQASYGTSPLSATTVATNVTVATALTRGSGVLTGTGAASNAWGGTDWATTDSVAAVTANDHVSFAINANTGYKISLSSFTVNYRRPNTGAQRGELQYSLDGTTYNWAAPLSYSSTATSGATISAVSLSGISALQNIPASTTVRFRIVNWAASSATGAWYIYDKATGDDLFFTGTIAPDCSGAPTTVSANVSATTLCTGTSLSLTATATNASSYSWSGPNSFTSTAQNPAPFTVNTASAGIYTLTATNPCGSTFVTTTAITINTSPTAVSATPSASSICSGGSLTLTGAATNATSYSWSGPGSYTATVQNPSAITVNTASAGVYTLTATNTCGNTTATASVTIITTPTAVSANVSGTAICNGATLTLTGAATGATAYSWSGPNSFTSTNQNPSAITVATASAGIYSFSATNTCGTTAVTTSSVSVNTAPTAVSASASTTTLCTGNSLTLTGTATGATTYSWSGPGSYSATDLNPTAITVSSAAAGIYTLTATNSCGNTTATTSAITINPLPTPSISGTTTILIGTSTTLTFTGTSGDVVAYSWTGGSSATLTITPSGTNIVTVSPSSTTTYSITSATSTAGCTASITGVSATVTVDLGCTVPPTSVSANPSATTICTGSALTLSGAATNATSYSWAGPGGFSSTVLNPAAITTSTTSAGIYTFTATNACGSTSVTTSTITIITAPTAVTATPSATTLCSGNTLTLTGAASGATTYFWSGPNSFSSTSLSPAAITTTTLSSGIYTFTATNTCGSTTATTSPVTVNGAPLINAITGTTSVSVGSSTTLSNTTPSGTWSSSNTTFATVSTAGVVYGVLAGTATISYTVSNSCGSTSVTTTVTINAIPVVLVGWDVNGQSAYGTSPLNATTVATNVTLSTALTRGAGVVAGTGAASNAWGGTDWATTDSAAAVTANDYATFAITANAGYKISLSSFTLNYRRPNTGAQRGELQYSLDGVTYNWAAPLAYTSTASTGATISAVNLSGITALQNVASGTTVRFRIVNWAASAATGAWYIYDKVTGGDDIFFTGTIAPNCTTAPTAVTATASAASLCTGSSLTLSASATGAVSYSWSGPNSFASTAQNPAAFTVNTASAGIYTLSATNPCGTSTATTTINILTSPTAVTATASASSLCVGNSLTLTGAATNATSYSWSGPNSFTSTDLNPASITTTTLSSGVYTLTATNTCGSAAASTTSVLINAGPVSVTATAPASVCNGATLALTGTATAATSYSWSGPAGFTSTDLNPGAFTTTTLSTGVYTLTATNSCGSTSATTTAVTINTPPTSVTATATPTTLCNGSLLTLSGNASGATTYSWSGPNSYSATNLNPSAVTVNSLSAGIYTLTANNSCGGTSATTVSVTITPPPAATISGTATVLIGHSTTLTFTGTNGDIVYYSWTGGTSSSITIGATGTNTITVSPTSTTTYNIDSARSSTGCFTTVTGQSATVTIDLGCTVAPTSVSAALSSAAICSGNTLTLSGAATNAISYSWSGPAGFTSTDLNPSPIITGTASAGVFTLTATNPCGSTSATTAALVINTIPTGVTASPSTTTLCSGSALTLTGTATGAIAYSWAGPGSFSATELNPSAITTTTLSAGIYTLTATNSCGNTTATTATISINTVPVVNVITGSSTVVAGNNITLSNTTPSGTWSSSNTAIATVAAGVVHGIAAGSTIISYTVTNGCGSTSATITINVTPVASVLVGWNVSTMPGGTNNFGTSPLTPTNLAANITVSPALTRGTGVSTTGSGAGRAWGGLDWITASAAAAVTAGDSIGFTMKPNSGYALNLSAFILSYRRSSTGATMGELQYSVGGAAYATAGTLTYSSTSNSGATLAPVDLSGITALQNIPATSSVKFRIVNYGATATGGTWYIFDVANDTTSDITFQGSVICAGTPAAGTVAGTSSFCGSGSAALSFTPGNTGSGMTYQWSGSTSATSSFTPVAGATSTSYTTPTVTTTTYYNVTSTCSYSGLSSLSSNDTVKITPIPATPATINGLASVCVGSSITLTDTSAGGTWTSGAPTIATINTSGVVTGLTAGAATITYTVSNSCGTAYITKPITVNPLPSAGVVTGAPSVCVTTTTLFSDTTTSGTWSSSDPSVATINASGLITGLTLGTATISYGVTNVCGTAYATSLITVSNSPSAGIISGMASVCPGNTTTLTDGTPGGTWSSSDNSIATVSASGIVTGVNSGSATISYTLTTTCGTATSTAGITVNSLPATPPAITGATSVCQGSTTTLANATTGGTWSSSNTSVATITTTGIVTGVSSGSVIITYTVTNSCGATYITAPLTINSLPVVAAITGSTTLCTTTSVTLSNTTTGGTWSSSLPSVATVNALGVVTGLASGTSTISYTVTNACGSTTVTTSVTVNAPPALTPITGTTTIAIGTTTTLSNTTTGGIWSSLSSAIATISATGIVTGVSLGATTITYTTTNSCGNTNATATITVNPVSTPANVTFSFTAGTAVATSSSSVYVPASSCTAAIGNSLGTVATAIATTSASSGYTGATGTYNMGNAVKLGSLDTGTSSFIEFTMTPNSGYYIIVNGISFGSRGTTTGPQAYTVSSNAAGYNVALASGTLANTSTWSLYTPTFTPAVGAANTPVKVRVYGYGGSGAPGSGTVNWRLDDINLSITANQIPCLGTPEPGTVTGATAFCTSGSTTLSFTPGTSMLGTSYQWMSSTSTDTASFTPVAGATSTSYTTPVLTDTTYYHVVTSCSYSGLTGTTANTAITVNPLPTALVTGTTSICEGASTTISFTGSAFDTVYYTINGGTVQHNVLGATGNYAMSVNPTTTSVYNVTSATSAAGCSSVLSGPSVTITVTGGPTIALGATPSVCQPTANTTISYTVSSGTPTLYSITWDTTAISAGFSNVSGAALTPSTLNIAIPTAGTPGSFNGVVSVSNGTCYSTSSYPVTISVYAKPVAAITSAIAPCIGNATDIIISGTPGVSITYKVDSGSDINATITGAGIYTINTGTVSTTHNYTLINAYNLICTTLIDTVAYVNPIPMQWIGGTAGHLNDWNTASNWTCGTVPVVTSDVTIPTGATYIPTISASDTGTANNITLAAGAILTINNAAILHIRGALRNNGTISGAGKVMLNGTTNQTIKGIGTVSNLDLNNTSGATIDTGSRLMISTALYLSSGTLATNDSLELTSVDALSTARIAPIPSSGAAISGKVKVDQYIAGGYRRFRFWSHPFSSPISLSQMQQFIDITGVGGAANGFQPTATNAPSSFRFDPRSGNDTLSYDPGWKAFTKINASAADSNQFQPYQGIRLFFRGAKGEGILPTWGTYTPSATTVKMSGTVNQGPQTITLTKGVTNPTHQSFNMIGNPYASPVDIGTILFNAKNANQIIGSSFYVWSPRLAGGGNYVAVDIDGTPYYLPAYGAFQVQAEHNGATLNFTESDKGASANNYLFKQSANQTTLSIYDTDNNLWDMLRIRFSNDATDSNDTKLDAVKIVSTDFKFYSITDDARKLAIDARPYSAEKIIPLGIGSAYKQNFIIKADNIAVPNGGSLYLHDKFLNKSIELSTGTEYKFAITDDKATQGDNRFELAMKPVSVTNTALHVTMTPNPTTEDVKISFTSGSKEKISVRVLDMSGVSVYSEQLGVKQNGNVSLPLSNFASGIYMVEFTQGNEKIVQRLVKE